MPVARYFLFVGGVLLALLFVLAWATSGINGWSSLEEGAVLEVKGKTLRDQLGARLIEESGADFDAPVAAGLPSPAAGRERNHAA